MRHHEPFHATHDATRVVQHNGQSNPIGRALIVASAGEPQWLRHARNRCRLRAELLLRSCPNKHLRHTYGVQHSAATRSTPRWRYSSVSDAAAAWRRSARSSSSGRPRSTSAPSPLVAATPTTVRVLRPYRGHGPQPVSASCCIALRCDCPSICAFTAQRSSPCRAMPRPARLGHVRCRPPSVCDADAPRNADPFISSHMRGNRIGCC